MKFSAFMRFHVIAFFNSISGAPLLPMSIEEAKKEADRILSLTVVSGNSVKTVLEYLEDEKSGVYFGTSKLVIRNMISIGKGLTCIWLIQYFNRGKCLKRPSLTCIFCTYSTLIMCFSWMWKMKPSASLPKGKKGYWCRPKKERQTTEQLLPRSLVRSSKLSAIT